MGTGRWIGGVYPPHVIFDVCGTVYSHCVRHRTLLMTKLTHPQVGDSIIGFNIL